MSFFDELKAKAALGRLTEEMLYSAVLQEVQSGQRRDGLWAKALQQSKFNETEAKAIYIGLRVQSLKDEIELDNFERKKREVAELQKASSIKAPPREQKLVAGADSLGIRIPPGAKHTDEVYSCNNCDYSGKLFIVPSGFFQKILVCPVCGNRNR
jgi:hypothetical protein